MGMFGIFKRKKRYAKLSDVCPIELHLYSSKIRFYVVDEKAKEMKSLRQRSNAQYKSIIKLRQENLRLKAILEDGKLNNASN